MSETKTKTLSHEVLAVVGGVVRVGASDMREIMRRAIRSSRKRARLCTHPDASDPLHEMLICLAADTYVRPHRHAGKSESFHIIDGELDVVLFGDDGRIRDVVHLAPYRHGTTFFYRLMEPCFHTVLVKTPQVLFHETTNGPFNPAETEFASWAPAEGDPDVEAYLAELQRLVSARRVA